VRAGPQGFLIYINARRLKDKDFMPIFALFVLFPLLELWVFVEACGEIGFFTALLLLVLAGIIGSGLVRYQGFQTVLAMHDALDRGRVPLNTLFDGFCIVAAGILLIFPGFISDIMALLLLMPRMRGFLRSFVQKHPRWHTNDSGVIEGEYEHVMEEATPLPPKAQNFDSEKL
jgi:UPF0716 family protein affecting phage T7 exclusion